MQGVGRLHRRLDAIGWRPRAIAERYRCQHGGGLPLDDPESGLSGQVAGLVGVARREAVAGEGQFDGRQARQCPGLGPSVAGAVGQGQRFGVPARGLVVAAEPRVARQAWTRSEWQNKQWQYDLGEVVVWHNSRGPLTDIVGSAGIAWNYGRNQYFEHLGYPFYPPFSGNLHECDAPYATQENPDGILGISGPNTIGIGCDSTEGSSGGPWFFGFNSGSSGWVNGHTSYAHDSAPLTKYSPYFGSAARDLCNTAANS